jgi:hypothetical protein
MAKDAVVGVALRPKVKRHGGAGGRDQRYTITGPGGGGSG